MAATKISRNLIMKFQSQQGNTLNITVKNAVDNLDGETVSTNMDTIVSKGVFQYQTDDPIISSLSAIERVTTEKLLFGDQG